MQYNEADNVRILAWANEHLDHVRRFCRLHGVRLGGSVH